MGWMGSLCGAILWASLCDAKNIRTSLWWWRVSQIISDDDLMLLLCWWWWRWWWWWWWLGWGWLFPRLSGGGAEGSKKTRLSDPTVNHLQLHNSIPHNTHKTDTYVTRRRESHKEKGNTRAAQLGRWDWLSGMAPVSLITSLRMNLFICWLLQRGPSIRNTLPSLVWKHLEEHCSHEETHACKHHETPWKETDAPCLALYRCWCPLQVFWFGPCHLFRWIQFRDRVIALKI